MAQPLPIDKSPTMAELNSDLRYDDVTGRLFWNVGKRIGKEALCTISSKGYKIGHYKKYSLRSHRVIFFLRHGYWPDQIDHINGIRTDNRIENLRASTNILNSRNRALSATNTSGVCGVSWVQTEQKWRAAIKSDGAFIVLGSFKEKLHACIARQAAETVLGFTPRERTPTI